MLIGFRTIDTVIGIPFFFQLYLFYCTQPLSAAAACSAWFSRKSPDVHDTLFMIPALKQDNSQH